jgi:biotin carboxyl carrier protein
MPVPAGIPAGFRNVGVETQPISFEEGDSAVEVTYSETRSVVTVTVDGEPVQGLRVWSATHGGIDLEVDGVRRRYRVHQVGDVHYVDSPLGSSALREVPRFPDPEGAVAAGSLLAPMPGSVVRLLVGEGDEVTQGQVLVALEAMKMEHSIRSPHDGVVHEVHVAVGQQVETGEVLLVVEAPNADE